MDHRLPRRPPDGQGEGRGVDRPRVRTARSCSCAPSAAPTGWCTQLRARRREGRRDPRRPASGCARAGARRLHRRQGQGARRHRRRGPWHPRRRRRRRRALRPAEDDKAYLHRSGRTARAGESGVAVTLMLWNQENDIRVIQRRLGLPDPRGRGLLQRPPPRRPRQLVGRRRRGERLTSSPGIVWGASGDVACRPWAP